jgi:hypothetical protein
VGIVVFASAVVWCRKDVFLNVTPITARIHKRSSYVYIKYLVHKTLLKEKEEEEFIYNYKIVSWVQLSRSMLSNFHFKFLRASI